MKKLNSCMQKAKDAVIKMQNHPDIRFRRETKERLDKIETKLDTLLNIVKKNTIYGTSTTG